ncbi:MAG: IS5 family transposase [Chlamydiae bacterium]|nr:IS5 family transposase [Chlamydiota bacterium]
MTKQTQTKYLIRNWSEYNRALVNRGSLTFWFSEASIENWLAKCCTKRGRPRIYSDDAILCALMVKAVYRLPFRALRGFILSLVQLLHLALPVPCYSQICRRATELGQQIEKLGTKDPTDIVFDSSGLKVYGEGEWKVRQHGKSKGRTWRKIHLAVCPDSHEIVLSYLGENNEADCEVVPKMKDHLPRSIKRSYGDGAYDKEPCYREFHRAGINPIIPPQRGAVLHDLSKEPWMRDRNDAIRAITGLGNDDEARKIWKRLMGYHRRSLGETGFYRWKTIFGGEVKARKIPNQRGEIYAKSMALNKMTGPGMPKGEWVAV